MLFSRKKSKILGSFWSPHRMYSAAQGLQVYRASGHSTEPRPSTWHLGLLQWRWCGMYVKVSTEDAPVAQDSVVISKVGHTCYRADGLDYNCTVVLCHDTCNTE